MPRRHVVVPKHWTGKHSFYQFIERLRRSVNYEEVYLKDHQTRNEAATGLGSYLSFYDDVRLRQLLDCRTPAEAYLG